MRLPRALSNTVLKISSEGDFTTSLGNLFQCLLVLMVKSIFENIKTEFPLKQLVPVAIVLPMCVLVKTVHVFSVTNYKVLKDCN